VCGDHRLYCGSARDASSYRALMAGEKADVVFADPLHNVPATAWPVPQCDEVRDFANSASYPTSEEFIDFLQTPLANVAGNVVDGAIIFVCMAWRRLDELSAATRKYFGKPRDIVVWVTAKGEQGALYRSQHQLVAVYIAGRAPLTNKTRGERGRRRTNVWTGYQGSGRRNTAISVDPMMKPVTWVTDVLRDSSKRGQIVLDPFAGVGTTMVAAERADRRARLIEIDPSYCDLIVRRWQTFSGKTAQLAESQQTFAELEARRIGASGGPGGALSEENRVQG